VEDTGQGHVVPRSRRILAEHRHRGVADAGFRQDAGVECRHRASGERGIGHYVRHAPVLRAPAGDVRCRIGRVHAVRPQGAGEREMAVRIPQRQARHAARRARQGRAKTAGRSRPLAEHPDAV